MKKHVEQGRSWQARKNTGDRAGDDNEGDVARSTRTPEGNKDTAKNPENTLNKNVNKKLK